MRMAELAAAESWSARLPLFWQSMNEVTDLCIEYFELPFVLKVQSSQNDMLALIRARSSGPYMMLSTIVGIVLSIGSASLMSNSNFCVGQPEVEAVVSCDGHDQKALSNATEA